MITEWEVISREPAHIEMIPDVVNGFGAVLTRKPLQRYRVVERRWHITIIGNYATREPEHREWTV